MKQAIALVIVFIFSFTSCKEEYNPPVISTPNSFLVVEANLDPSGPTTLRLTKTFKLDASASVVTENNAQVTVEGKDNTIRNLIFSGNGYYASSSLNLVVGNEYRLRIKTATGKEYLSEYIKTQITPPIDSITWEREADGVRLFSNTKDPNNATRYYKWEYMETWEYHSPLPPFVIYDNGIIRDRIFPQEDVSVCWASQPSTNILLANSTRLQSDIINKAPIHYIPVGDERISVRYSILLKQYALHKDAYDFFELLKKNTENLGSVFDAQPSEIKGNISCVSNPSEPVIGFITSSTVTEKRIFISNDQVAPWRLVNNCEFWPVAKNSDSVRLAVLSGYMLFADGADHWDFSLPRCVDCTAKGGTNVKPAFW